MHLVPRPATSAIRTSTPAKETTIRTSLLIATSEAVIREHAQKSGFPADRITPVAAVIDPTTSQAGR